MEKMRRMVRDIALPSYLLTSTCTNTNSIQYWNLPAIFYITWPDGSACHLANMYLLDIAEAVTVRRHDGGTLKYISADLVHFIRYCWQNRLDFTDLRNNHFHVFVQELVAEKRLDHARVRNNNTVNRIIDRSIHFLQWLQTYVVHDRKLVGLAPDNAQVHLAKKSFRGYRGQTQTKLSYIYAPTKDTTDPKHPMPLELRNKLISAISSMSEQAKRQEEASPKKSEFAFSEISFLLKRRQLFLRLLEATGCRPGELAELSVSKNKSCAHSEKLIIPTLKRRKSGVVDRRIPIDGATAIKLFSFIKNRDEYLYLLKDRGVKIVHCDNVFVCSRKGTPLSPISLATEFSRVVSFAGITDKRCCMSMFRHRFITNLVKIYLREFLLNKSCNNRHNIQEADYRTILSRVKVFTGHSSELSLFNYIDWAWDELDIFSGANAKVSLLQDIQGIQSDIEDIETSALKESEMKSLQRAISKLSDIYKKLNHL